MSVEEIDTDLDIDGYDAPVTTTQRRKLKIYDLFDEYGELRLREETAGWNGYLREEIRYPPLTWILTYTGDIWTGLRRGAAVLTKSL